MNYQIITNEEELLSFINWLPDLEPDEKFYCALFARKKYHASIPSDKAQVKRFLAHKGNLLDKIRQLECPVGSYKIGDLVIPQEALAFYISPNPRDLRKATYSSIKKLVDLVYLQANGYNPHAEVLSEIQKSKSRTFVLDFDVDEKIDMDLLEHLKNRINPDSIKILQTRGGYHILVRPDLVYFDMRKTFFNLLKGNLNTDQTGDLLLPCPGCLQGGFTPKFI